MTLARIYRKSPEAIVSYSYTDFASKTGIVIFYGYKDEDSYKLTQNTLYSNRVMTTTTHSSPGGTDYTSHDLDFDILFNAPQVIRGQVIATVPFGVRNTFGTTQNYARYVKIYVRKWDGSNETEIANDTSEQFGDAGTTYALTAGSQHRLLFTTSVTVPTTLFKAGEYLRITVEAHGWNGGATSDYFIGHDPANRATDGWESTNTFNTDPSIMKFEVPFKIPY